MAKGIGLAGGFGAGGVRDALVDILAQRMAQAQFDEQKRARGEEERQGRTALQQRAVESATNADLARTRLTQDEGQFRERHGLDVKTLDEGTRRFDTGHAFQKEQAGVGQRNKERDFERGAYEFDVTAEEGGRHHRAMEGIAGERAATAGAKKGGSALTAEMRNKISKLTETAPIVDRLEELSKTINRSEGPGARLGGMVRGAKASAGADNEASVYRSLSEGFLGQIARLSGEVGVLTDQDVKRAKRLVPQLTDTAGEAKAKFQELRGLLTSRRAALEGEVPLGDEGPIDVPDPRGGGGSAPRGGSTSAWDLYQQRLKGGR